MYYLNYEKEKLWGDHIGELDEMLKQYRSIIFKDCYKESCKQGRFYESDSFCSTLKDKVRKEVYK